MSTAIRLALHSDLHEEVYGEQASLLKAYSDLPQADVVILAGDIHHGCGAVRFAEKLRQAQQADLAILIAGNHEYFMGDYVETRESMLSEAEKFPQVAFLSRGSLVYQNIRFIGATLWTDFNLYGAEKRPHAMQIAHRMMLDYRAIQYNAAPFNPTVSQQLHQEDLHFIQTELSKPFAGKTIVLTHHAPSLQVIAPQFQQDITTVSFASNLDYLMLEHEIAYWFYGHTHYSNQYQIGNTTIMANCRGYPREHGTTGYNAKLVLTV